MNEIYISPNDNPSVGYTSENPWGWIELRNSYNENTNETEVILEIGYDGDTQEDALFFHGDVTADVLTAILQEPEFVNSVPQVVGGGFPKKL